MSGFVIFGAGGLAREVHDIVEALGHDLAAEFFGFIAPEVPAPDLLASRGPLLGGDEVIETLPFGTGYVIGIGSPRVKRGIDELATAHGLVPRTLVHPRAVVGRHGIELGAGTVVGAGVTVTTDIRTGRHVLLDRNAVIGHDTVIGDYSVVSPLASIAGAVRLGDGVLVGTGASVIQGVVIGDGATVGAGAAVIREVPAGATVVGVPAKPLGAV